MLRRLSDRQALLLLAVVLALALALSAGVGAFSFTPGRMLSYLAQTAGLVPLDPADALARGVFVSLRLPRVLLAALAGAVLGVSGALMQGLFRNPIVEPGLAGTSAGAALGAALVFVLGGARAFAFASLGSIALPVTAFLGALAATLLVYGVSTAFGKVDVFTMLLAGIAVNAVCNAGTGFLSYIARDPQARNITFWNLGTFTTATWQGVIVVGVVAAVSLVEALRHGKSLNALMLGEDEAHSLGIEPRRLFLRLVLVNTAMVAVLTAMVGVIAFVGLVVPHVLRLVKSADYRFLLPAAALCGAAFLELADVVARLVIAPAELPIGILTAVVGAPVFLAILLRQRRQALPGFGGA